MTNYEILKLAGMVGLMDYLDLKGDSVAILLLKSFAKEVAEKEREACAKVCEEYGVHPALNVFNGGPDWYKHGKDCAKSIRARGEE
jgi:hypothetical protein